MGHYANECPNKKGKVGNAIQAVTFGELQSIGDDDIHIDDFSYLLYEETISENEDDNTADTAPTSVSDNPPSENPSEEDEENEESNVEEDDYDSEGGYSDSSNEDEDPTGPYYATGALIKKVDIPDKFDNRRIYSFGTMLVVKQKNGVLFHIGDLDSIDNDVSQLATSGVSLCQKPEVYQRGQRIDPHWILLDSHSTIDMFSNEHLLQNIRASKHTMRVRGTGGVESTNLIGNLPGYGEVWYKQDSIANILSLARVCSIYQVTFDSDHGNCFVVHRPDTFDLHFCQSREGLYYYDTRNEEFSLVHTVAQNKQMYTDRQVNQAESARRLYAMIGRPSNVDFENIIRLHIIPDCPTTIDDVCVANKIFGPDVGSLKGKTTRRKPSRVQSDVVFVPSELVQIHKNVILAVDVMFVNSQPFFVSISRNIKFTTIQALPNRTHDNLMHAIKAILSLYSQAGFHIQTVLADGEFEHLRTACIDVGIHLNTTSANEHVLDIERQIRVLKERARAI